MGAGDQQEAVSLATSIVNDSLQNVANYCTITCVNNINNVDYTFIGGDVSFNINQSCSIVGSECMVKNLVGTQVDNLIQNIVKQTESNLGIFSLFGPASNESTNITNAIENQISQIISNTCRIESSNNVTNSSVFAQDIKGNFSIGQTGQVSKSDCALDTVAKVVLNNKVQNQVTQTESSCGSILGILIIVGIVAACIILFPILFETGKLVASGIAAGRKRIVEPLGGKKQQQ
jgi:hypothetical protein